MGTDLLIGVMTASPPTEANPTGATDSTMLVIVDKRVSDELAPAPARSVTVVLGAEAGSNLQHLFGGVASVTFDQATRLSLIHI